VIALNVSVGIRRRSLARFTRQPGAYSAPGIYSLLAVPTEETGSAGGGGRKSKIVRHAPAIGLVDDRDRKRVVEGKSVSVRVDLGGRRCIKKNNQKLKEQ